MDDKKLILELEKEIGNKLKLIYPGWVTSNVVTNYGRGYVITNGVVTGLNLHKLDINEFPETIFKLKNIKLLRISNNNLSKIPSKINRLTQLVYLNLDANNISTLPHGLFSLNLEIIENENEKKYGEPHPSKGLIFHNNPIKYPPIEIVKRGKKAINEFFKSIDKGPKTPLNEGKLIIVGDGGAGKTSLVKQIIGRKFDQNERQTHGIKIKNWKIQSGSNKISVNIWDFGGQEIMHATHQFFLSKRCLYILVLDGRKDEKTEYWLKHVESFGGNSPIIIVINKIDENPGFEVNRKFLKDKYDEIKGFFRISCKTGEGIIELIQKLKKELSKIEIIKTTWPTTWFNVKKSLENMTVNYISCKKYEEICEAEKIIASESQEILLDFLHDLGVVIHFRDLPLKDLNVINPKWITEAVYNIINSRQLADAKGILFVNLLNEILDKQKYPIDKHNYIIELMKKFELCYSIETNKVLIPNLLAVEEPVFPSFNHPNLNFVFSYDFLPKSIIPRFIVKMNKHIKDNLRWRTGVVLEDSAYNAIAIVKSDDEERRIAIKISGNQKRDYFSVIRHKIRDINNGFEKIEITELVPLPDNKKIEIEYIELIAYEIAKIDEMFIGKLGKKYSVKQLLNGIEDQEKRKEEALRVINVQGNYYEKSKTNITNENINGNKIEENVHINKIKENIHGNKVEENLHGNKIEENVHGNKVGEIVHGNKIKENIHGNKIGENLEMYQAKNWERIVVYLTGFLFISVISFLLIRNEPFSDPNLVVVLRTILSLIISSFGATVPGMLNVDFSKKGIIIRASGALALFILSFLLTPQVLPPIQN